MSEKQTVDQTHFGQKLVRVNNLEPRFQITSRISKRQRPPLSAVVGLRGTGQFRAWSILGVNYFLLQYCILIHETPSRNDLCHFLPEQFPKSNNSGANLLSAWTD